MNIKLFFSILIAFVLVISCNKSDNNSNPIEDCDSPIFLDNFSKITAVTTYVQAKNLFGIEGDNFRNDKDGASETKFYRWYSCAKKTSYVSCWFKDGKLILAEITLKNKNCGNFVTSSEFLSLNIGMTYDQIKSILGDAGNNFRNDYDYYTNTEKMKFYRFYDCSSPLKFIEVWFDTKIGASTIVKNY